MTADLIFPAHAEDLPAGAHWTITEYSEGEGFYDLGIMRWDEDLDRWTRRRHGVSQADYDANPTNDKFLVHGAIVRAPASGVVKASWHGQPDNDPPGTKRPDVVGADPAGATKKIYQGGNHVIIETDDGDCFHIAHLEPFSIPDRLVPHVDDGDVFPSTLDKDGSHGIAAMIPAAQRPRVQAGDIIGRAGNSGNSGAPHIHISAGPVVTDTDDGATGPLPFRGAFHRPHADDAPLDPSGWDAFDGSTLSPSLGNALIHPGMVRLGDITAGAAGQCVLHFVRSRRVVTALRDADGNLKLVVWDVGTDGAFARRGGISAGTASRLAMVEPRSDLLVTALRDGDGNLRLVSWRVDGQGNLTRCATATAGPVSRVSLATVQEGVVVVAVRDADGNLKLVAFQVASNGAFTRRGDASAGAIGDVVVTRSRRADGVVTAVLTGAGEVKVIAWTVSGNGSSVQRGGSAEAGAASRIAAAPRGTDDRWTVTAVRDSADNLRVIAWEVGDGGGTVTRRGTGVAGEVSELAITGARPGRHLDVAVRDSDGALRVTSWRLDGNGSTVERWGGGRAGSATNIAAAGSPDADHPYLVTSCSDSDGNLKLISWRADR